MLVKQEPNLTETKNQKPDKKRKRHRDFCCARKVGGRNGDGDEDGDDNGDGNEDGDEDGKCNCKCIPRIEKMNYWGFFFLVLFLFLQTGFFVVVDVDVNVKHALPRQVCCGGNVRCGVFVGRVEGLRVVGSEWKGFMV